MNRLTYRPDIDGLRAVAVLAVVAYHANPALVPGGFTGVDIFFVISGFLITSVLADSLAQGSFSATAFYARRIRRLLPALTAVLGASLLAGWLLLLTDELTELATHVVSSAMFVTNLVLWRESGYFDTAAELKPLLHLWSLGVEEQFYLIWPALLWLTWGRLRPVATIGGVALGSFAINLLTLHWSPSAAFYWPASRFWELAIGGLLACQVSPVPARAREWCAAAGVALVIAGFVLLRGTMPFPGWWALLPTLGAAFVIAAGADAWLNRTVLSWRPVVWVGLVSYPLYLWHWPLLTFARIVKGSAPEPGLAAVLVAIAIVLAWLTYRVIERPIRHTQGRLAIGNLVMACAGITATAVAVIAHRTSLPARFPPDVQALVDFSYRYEGPYRERECYLMPDQPPSALARDCVEQSPPGRPLVVLWGDSHAAHLYPGLQQLQDARGFRIAQFTGSRCPPLLDVETPTQPYCQDVNRLALMRIAALQPAVVLMSARWAIYGLSSLDETIAAVQQATPGRIVVMGPVPSWNMRLPRLLFNYVRQHPSQPLPMRTFFGLARYVWGFDIEMRSRVQHAGAEYVSAIGALCNGEGCLARVSDEPDSVTAWDDAHLTAAGSEYLVSRVAGQLTPRVSGRPRLPVVQSRPPARGGLARSRNR